MARTKAQPGEALDDRVQVRLPPAIRQSIDAAATAEGIPTSTWIRNQILASLYLGGVTSAPQVVYQGFRASIQDVLDNIEEITLAVRSLPVIMEHLTTAALIGGGLDPKTSADRAHDMLEQALAEAGHEWRWWLLGAKEEGVS